MKARKVKGLNPATPLGDNAERIVRVRLDELCGFMPTAADPAEVVALHDMRIAAKRLRYILEVTGPCFGPYAKTAVKMTKDLQDLLGEIHDCDVQVPEVTAVLSALIEDDARALVARAGDAAEITALHDMRIAAKRLRYILEITHPCFGPYAEAAVKSVKELQEVLGEVHDCDVQLPEVRAFLDQLVVTDAEALLDGAAEPPHREAYGGLVGLTAELLARREREYAAFLRLWQELERNGFRARLEYAIRERSGRNGPATIDPQ